MLDEILDPFKRGDFIQHFIKEEKIHVGWCWMKVVQEEIFYSTLCYIQHKKYILDSFKVVYHPHLISNTISNLDFKVFERSNVYSSGMLLLKITRGHHIHSVLSFTVRSS